MTLRACIIGHPVGHSRSPLVHGFWLRRHGIDGSYGRADVQPGDLERFLAAMPGEGWTGGNVTVPHKEAAFRLVEVDDPAALALGAINTLWVENGRIRGCNTDVEGFLANLDQEAQGWDDRLGKVVVVGAGGAARAVAYGLLERRARSIVVLNRTQERAEALAGTLGEGRIEALPWAKARAALADAALLVNTTSLGMQGQPPLELDLEALPDRSIVNDIVYVPLVTPLLRAAAARGNRTVDGLGMLLHQAVPGFRRWFGVTPSVTGDLRALVAADVERPARGDPP